MAAVTALGNSFSTASGSHTATATPAVGDLIVIVTVATGNTATTAPTDDNADGLGTYTRIVTAVTTASADTMLLFIRDKMIGSATSTNFTHNPGTSTGGGLLAAKVTGMVRVSSLAALQSQHQDNQGAGGTPAPALGATPQTGNPVIAAVMNATNPATMTPRAGYTELVDTGYLVPQTGIEVMERDSGESSATITWGGTSATAFCSIAVELDASPVTRRTSGPRVGSRSQ